MTMDDDEFFAELGCEKADDSNDHLVDDPLDADEANDLDLEFHHPENEGDTAPIEKTAEAWIDMGVRCIARSAESLVVLNTLEVLPPFELSV